MKIVNDYPPNIAEIQKNFDIVRKGVLFAYGDTIYNPDDIRITADLIAHEETHERQQAGNPALWWAKYLEDPKFRLDQEVEAYRNQLMFFKKENKDRNKVALFLHGIAATLSNGMYGSIINYQDAVKLIENE